MENENSPVRKKKIHDFSNGPVWDERSGRHLSEVRYPDGRRKKGRFRRQDKAWAFWNDEQKKIRDGSWSEKNPKNFTFCKGLDAYRHSKRGYKSYRTSILPTLRFWEREIPPETRLSKITEEWILDILQKGLERGLKKSTLDNYLVSLKSAFKFLVRKKLCLGNPTSEISLFRIDNRRLIFLHPDQMVRALESSEKEAWFVKPCLIIGAFAGLRKANVLGLEWPQIDLNTRLIRIMGTSMKEDQIVELPMCDVVYNTVRELSRTRRGTSRYLFADNKSSLCNGHRAFGRDFKVQAVQRVLSGEKMKAVALDLGVRYETLWRWATRVRESGEDTLHDIVKLEELEGPQLESRLDEAWARIRRDSGIEKDFLESHHGSFHFHDLRHSFASWHAIRGTSFWELQDLLGHDDPKSTKRYLRLSKLHPGDPRLRILIAKIEYLLIAPHAETPTTEKMRVEFAKIDDSFPKHFPLRTTTED